MKRNLYSFLISFLNILLVLFLFSCSSNPNNPGNGLSGNLSGKIILENGFLQEESDHSGAIVEAVGTSYRTESTVDGSWRLENLPAGTYVIKVSKDGYTHRKVFGYQFVGGGEAYFYKTYLTRLPSHSAKNLTAVIEDTVHQDNHHPDLPDSIRQVAPYVRFAMDILNAPMTGDDIKLQMYVSRNPNVSYREGEYDTRRIFYLPGTFTSFSFPMNDYLNRGDFTSGERIYVVIYPAANGTHGGEYFDNELGHEVDSDVVDNPSNVVSIVIP
ncbi:MAG: carboxypeptidase regulatory-like domain-containing protein [Ignavibacteriae bacterium]|nr:carboxypeptidase regulatory-like domain-containing protein [Ignavibacteriota bacterium]MCB9216044.1 carboxypeptidase regulatory-like domain-containing protein [Ignavibacteria bacterium]